MSVTKPLPKKKKDTEKEHQVETKPPPLSNFSEKYSFKISTESSELSCKMKPSNQIVCWKENSFTYVKRAFGKEQSRTTSPRNTDFRKG
ncbi:hypothetical protein CEXT_329791 [Caerostris extrusa]|uniref:Uncharacterized protein n=1 Tax=Caerostris extrusa TaxID=172846 RepID=A0AAV4MP41_CAEEX|nr:hypothetical protein CEXT_329791 [Caerostris extrusa]